MLQTRAMMFSALVVSGLAVSATSAATVGPGTAFTGGTAYPLSPFIAGNPGYTAVRFSVPSDFIPTTLDVVINQTSTTAGQFVFEIVTGTSSAPNLASVLANFTLNTTGSFAASVKSPTLTTTPSPTLAPATDYWLVGRGTGSTAGSWNSDSGGANPQGTVVFDLGFGGGTSSATLLPAFLLSGVSPIPLPASSMMGGALVLGLLARRKH